MLKWIWLLTTSIYLHFACVPGESLGTNYEIINNYLEEHVESEEPTANIVEAKKWLASDQTIKSQRALAKALQFFTMLEHINDEFTRCSSIGFRILEKNEELLLREQHEKLADDENYQPKRLDRIIEHYAVEQFESCGVHYFDDSIKLDYCLNRNMYNRIDELLSRENEQTHDNGAEAQMAKASELLDKTLTDRGENSLTNALRLFLGLKSTIDGEDNCGERTYSILIMNNLATPFEKKDSPKRGIDKLVDYYSLKSADACLVIYPTAFKSLIRQLDMAVLRSLRVIVSESLLGHSLASETDQLQFEQEFTTSDLTRILSTESDNNNNNYREMWNFNPLVLMRIIQALASSREELALTEETDTKDSPEQMQKQVDHAKLTHLYEKYVQTPCERYLATVNRMFIYSDYHRAIYNRANDKMSADYYDKMDASTNAGIILGKGLQRVCGLIISGKKDYLKELFLVVRVTIE